MNKNILNFILTIVLAYLLALVLPWWSVMVASFVTALLIPLKRFSVFFTPFFAILLFWFCYSFILSSANDFLLAKKIAALLPLGGNPYLLMLVSGIVGGLAAGISAILGKQIQMIFNKK